MPENRIEPPFISDPHFTFTVTVTCVDCGWHWEGWLSDAYVATYLHTRETDHAAV